MIFNKATVSILIIFAITESIDTKSVEIVKFTTNTRGKTLNRSSEEVCNDSVRILNAKQIIKQLTNMLQQELKNLNIHESADVKRSRKIIQINLLMKLKSLKSNCPNSRK